MRVFRRVIVSVFLLFLSSCGSERQADRTELHIAAATNLLPLLDELKAAFEHAHPSYQVHFIAGSSGKITAGILNGAELDLFLAADMSYPQAVVNHGLADSVYAYCYGRLLLFSRHGDVEAQWAQIVDGGQGVVAMANPALAPYGRAAEEVLKKWGVYERVSRRTALAESVAQTVQQALTGADVAFIPASALYTESMRPYTQDETSRQRIDEAFYTPIRQGLVVLKPKAVVFKNFMLSETAQKLFEQFGYRKADGAAAVQQPTPKMPFSMRPFYVSLKLAFCTTLVLFIIGVPLAALLAYRRFYGHLLLDTLVTLPLVLPPTVLGFYLLLLLGPNQGLGWLLAQYVDVRLIYNFKGILIASCIYSLPFMIQPVKSGLAELDTSLIEASYLLGKSRLQTFFHVILPNIKTALITGIVMTFAHTLGEFGVIMMVGGNISASTRPASVAIYENVEALQFESAHIYSGVLLALSVLFLLAMNLLNRYLEREKQ